MNENIFFGAVTAVCAVGTMWIHSDVEWCTALLIGLSGWFAWRYDREIKSKAKRRKALRELQRMGQECDAMDS